MLGVGPTPQERGEVPGPAEGPRPQPTPAGRPEAQLLGGGAAPASDAGGAGNGPGGRPRRGPAPPRCREGSRPAAGGVGDGRPGLRPVGGEFSPGLACGCRPGPPTRGPRRREETHRKGPDPHLGVLPAARAFAQIRHGARPLPGGGFRSHSEAPVSHLRRAGRRGATLGAAAAARPPGWAGELAGPWAAAAGAAAVRSPAARARLGDCAGAAAPRGPPHARLGSLYRAPPRWRRRRRRTNISLRRPNVLLLLLLLLRLSETRSGPEGGGGRREGGEPESGEIGGRGGGQEGEAGGRGRRGTLKSREKRASALSRVGRGEACEREGATGEEEGNGDLGRWASGAER